MKYAFDRVFIDVAARELLASGIQVAVLNAKPSSAGIRPEVMPDLNQGASESLSASH